MAIEDLAHIDDFDIRQRPASDPLSQADVVILIRMSIVEGFHRWSRAAQYDDCIGAVGAHDGSIAAVITWGFLLLV